MYLQIQIIAINSASLPMLAYQNYQYGDYLFFKFFYIEFFSKCHYHLYARAEFLFIKSLGQ
jgi:hypothetical protein